MRRYSRNLQNWSDAVIFVIHRLETINEKQAIRIDELEEHRKLLESRLNQNSRNSSRPPSTDFFVKEKPNPKSCRKKTGRKPGGQKGHSGTTLNMAWYQRSCHKAQSMPTLSVKSSWKKKDTD
jgi:hypothetical protein